MPELRLTESRLREILRRQDPPKWGAAYEPAIRATREEAPSRSRPAKVWWEAMQRPVHVLSNPELWVLMILLYCPWLWELQEQRMLPFLPSPHPMASNHRACGMALPAMNGTLQVAERLGYLHWHPFLTIGKNKRQPAEDVPAPWIGDFLAYLEDDTGPFCVNINVKATRQGFSRPTINESPKINMKRAKKKTIARQEVERVLYDEAGIPTHEVAGDTLNEIVVANLQQIIVYQRRKTPFSSAERVEIIGELQRGMQAGKAALEVLQAATGSDQQRHYHAKTVMYQAIWQRQLRIDLFQHFFIDYPLIPESRDVLDEYGAWLRRPQS